MTTILFKHGQFQTEDGICFEDQEKIGGLIGLHEGLFDKSDIPEGSTYSIREKVEVVDVGQCKDLLTESDHCTCDDGCKVFVARIIEPMSTPEQNSEKCFKNIKP
jgi:hypothetical protein